MIKKPIVAPSELIIIFSISKLPRYVIICKISNDNKEIKMIDINLYYLAPNIIDISKPKGTKANRFPKLKNHNFKISSDKCFGNNKGIQEGII